MLFCFDFNDEILPGSHFLKTLLTKNLNFSKIKKLKNSLLRCLNFLEQCYAMKMFNE